MTLALHCCCSVCKTTERRRRESATRNMRKNVSIRAAFSLSTMSKSNEKNNKENKGKGWEGRDSFNKEERGGKRTYLCLGPGQSWGLTVDSTRSSSTLRPVFDGRPRGRQCGLRCGCHRRTLRCPGSRLCRIGLIIETERHHKRTRANGRT